MRLGSAFQKVNFLRDLKNDTEQLKRQYFPELVNGILTGRLKTKSLKKSILTLKNHLKALSYYRVGQNSLLTLLIVFIKTLLKKIQKKPAEIIMVSRIRISGFGKILLFIKAYLSYVLNLI